MPGKILLYFYLKHDLILLAPHPTALGNCCEEIYEALRVASTERKKILVFLPIYLNYKLIPIKTLSPRLFAIQSSYFILNPLNRLLIPIRILLWLVFIPVRTAQIYLRALGINGSKKDFIPYFGTSLLFNHIEKKRYVSYIKFDVQDAINAKKIRSKLGNYDVRLSKYVDFEAHEFNRKINKSKKDWYICLHVRTGGFYKDEQSVHRNATIANYIPLINAITDKGGWVFRLGDKSMPRLDKRMLIRDEMVIDLPHSEFNTPEINSWLIANCNCYVGMLSGPEYYARLFQRPIILTNIHTPFIGSTNEKNIIGIYKKFVDNVTGKEDNFLDVIEKSYFDPNDYTPLSHKSIELSGLDILNFTIPFIPFNSEIFQAARNYYINQEYDKRIIKVIKRYSHMPKNYNTHLFRWIIRTVHVDRR